MSKCRYLRIKRLTHFHELFNNWAIVNVKLKKKSRRKLKINKRSRSIVNDLLSNLYVRVSHKKKEKKKKGNKDARVARTFDDGRTRENKSTCYARKKKRQRSHISILCIIYGEFSLAVEKKKKKKKSENKIIDGQRGSAAKQDRNFGVRDVPLLLPPCAGNGTEREKERVACPRRYRTELS